MRFEQKAIKTLSMKFGKVRSVLLLFLIVFYPIFVFSQNHNDSENETLRKSLEILKRYFYKDNQWYVTSPSVAADVKGLINFIEDEPVDSVVAHLNNTLEDSTTYVFRLPENVSDSLKVPGYYPMNEKQKSIEKIGIQLQKDFQRDKIKVPESLTADVDRKVKKIPEGKGMKLFKDSIYVMPKRLNIPEVIPDSILNSPEKFKQLIRIDSARNAYIEQKRIVYNDSITSAYIDSVNSAYIKQKFNEELNSRIMRLNDSVKVNNYNVLRAYNEDVVKSVNDSILVVLKTLTDYANFIDSTQISIVNLTGKSSDILLKNGNERFARVWLKNIQQDSLSVMVKSIDKRSIYMLIDDGVTFSRYKPKETKDFDFKSLEKNISSLTKLGKSYDIQTPWVIGGEGHVGFSQIYLENWKKGGQSAISSLVVLKGFANYSRSDGLVKWVNSAEIRNGWIQQGGEGEGVQKNDDKFELTSRYSVSAYKKWFYSAELNYETQFFRGYTYPKKSGDKPISAFMAPARTFFKFGMEYKPSKEFSMLLSPLTIKNVYVRDTSLIDQTKFSIASDKKSFWEPGLNTDISWNTKLTDDISYATKYKMFINYKEPFSKYDINWENQIDFQLNNYINMRFLVHFIYDDDVLFPIYDANDVQIGEKAKLQMKEFFSIGFTYKINHKVMKSKRIR